MQHAAWVVAPLVLAGVLGFSGVTKLGQGGELRSIVANLEVPSWVLPGWLARLLPALEIALAVGLLGPWLPVFTVAAVAALGLMSIYWALIARGLTISPRPVCGCFGAVGDHRISGRTLLRNTLLVAAAVAAATLALSGRTVWTLLSGADAGVWLWLGLAALACAVTALIGGSGPQEEGTAVSQDVENVEDGDYERSPIPEAVLIDPVSSRPLTLAELAQRRAQLLVFVNCYCHSTKDVMARRDDWQERLDIVDVRIVFSVPIAEQFVGPPPEGTLSDHGGVAWRRLGLSGSPSAILLGVDGLLAGGPVVGPAQVGDFIDDVAAELAQADAMSTESIPEA